GSLLFLSRAVLFLEQRGPGLVYPPLYNKHKHDGCERCDYYSDHCQGDRIVRIQNNSVADYRRASGDAELYVVREGSREYVGEGGASFIEGFTNRQTVALGIRQDRGSTVSQVEFMRP